MFYKVIKFLNLTILFCLVITIGSYGEQKNEYISKYKVFAKFDFIPKFELLEIESELNSDDIYSFNDSEYRYNYKIYSTNITNLFQRIDAVGFVNGSVIKRNLVPKKYHYQSTRNDKIKQYTLSYKNEDHIDVVVDPPYDKTKLSPVSDEMILNTIDPATMFLIMNNIKKFSECSKDLKIYDGKRRYNIKIEKYEFISIDEFICIGKQYKLGGYKTKDDNVLSQPQTIYLKYIKINGLIDLVSINGKNNLVTFIIEKTL